MSCFSTQLKLNSQAGVPLIQVVSHDILRIHAECINLANALNRKLFIWNRVTGLREFSSEKTFDFDLPNTINWYLARDNQDDFADNCGTNPEQSILLLEDIHYELGTINPQLTGLLRLYALQKSQGDFSEQTILISQPSQVLPQELEKDMQVMYLPLPSRNELRTLMEQTQKHYGLDIRDFDPTAKLIDAALGLSTSEAQFAFAKVAVAKERLTESELDLIVLEKEQVIKKSGLLEYFHPQVGLNDIGGLDNLKNWLERRKNAFSEGAREYGLEYPRGILMLGLPGTGKSLSAKAVSSNWQLPLLRLDMGKIFAGIVGQSEDNMRAAVQMAETIAPCILWVDEIEKALAGLQSSGQSDGGATARVIGTFLTWMQEKTAPVFVLATANHIEMLPPELLRKGRMDEIFFVDLPTVDERFDILTIHLKKRNDRHELFEQCELLELANISKGFTGAELEEAVKEGLFRAFSEHREILVQDIRDAIKATMPLSTTMHDAIQTTRKWVEGRTVSASSNKPEDIQMPSKERPRLKQEVNNPFIKS